MGVYIMKGINLKLFSIFIILIFCLAPLSALDLNQDDNNTKYSDSVHNENLEVENSTFGANDTDSVEVKDANIESDEPKTAKETMKSLSNKTKSSDEREDSYVQLVISDTNPGNDIYIFVNALPTFTGDVSIKTSWSSETYNVHVKDGFAYIVLKNDLPVGTYKATVKFEGNDEFIPRESSKTFRIKEKEQPVGPFDPDLSVMADPCVLEEGNPVHIEVRANKSLTSGMTFKLNGYSYFVSVNQGYNGFTFSSLPAGNYTGTIIFDGNSEFLPSKATTSFEIRKKVIKPDPEISMTINDVYEGNKIFAEVHTNKTYSGYASIKLDDNPYSTSVRIDDGYGNATLSKDLALGEHKATVIFYEDEVFAGSQKTYSFQVMKKHEPQLKISVNSYQFDEPIVAEINANENLNGTVNVQLDFDKVYSVNLKEGHGKLLLDDKGLPTGLHVATVRFDGNEAVNPGETFTYFDFYKRSNMSIDFKVENGSVNGQGPKIHIKTNASEKVKLKYEIDYNTRPLEWDAIDVDPQGYTLEPRCIFVGDYTLKVKFEGDSNYYPVENITTFTRS